MTDKEQIILDGVDIAGCVRLQDDGISCDLGGECKGWGNCYYKQLKRKEQELETICKAFDIEYGYDEETGAIVGRCNKLIEKEKVLEEYKQSLDEKNKFLQDLGISASGEFKRIKFYIEDLNNANDHYRKALEEIEEVCLKDTYTFADGKQLRYDTLDDILDIINKAKGEGICQ